MAKSTLTREQAEELYRDLQKAVTSIRGKQGGAATEAAVERVGGALRDPSILPMATPRMVVTMVFVLAVARAVLSGLDVAGVTSLDAAQAAVGGVSPQRQVSVVDGITREEMQILTTLDARRAQLEDRAKLLETREQELARRDSESEVKIAELRELTKKLADARKQDASKKTAQLEQLANVYGSMGPAEAAALLEQLDTSIAIELLAKMPEKRIAQVLSSMSKERALQMTRLLSSKTR